MLTFLIWGCLAALTALAGIASTRERSVKVYVFGALIIGVLGGIAGWVFNPTLHPAFSYGWYATFIAFVLGVIWGGMLTVESEHEAARRSGPPLVLAVLGLVVFWVVGFFITSSFTRHADYHRLLGEPQAVDTFGVDVAPVDTTRLRIVNAAFATQIAEKMLGEQPGLGSQVRLDTMHIAQLNGCATIRQVGATADEEVCFEHELVWVAPAVHSGIFRWLSNRATHQYALVSASDPTRKFLVDHVDGEELHLRIHYRGAHFGDYLRRHLRENGYLTRGLTDFNFELDDHGRPWWVAVTYTKRIGFAGEDPTGVVVVNPHSGEIQEFGLDAIPDWVDRVQPEQMVLTQFDNWGRFGGGWLNSWTARRGVIQTSTYDLHLVEGTDGRTYWYTGTTGVGSDESTTGFVLIDTKTRETRIYRVPGATEYAAQQSAQNAPGARERQYVAGEPILYNMSGHPTYFMTLSGTDNIPRMYAFVSVTNFELVGAAETISAALQRYETALRGAGRSAIGQTVSVEETVAGTVLRIVRDGDGSSLLIRSGAETVHEYFAPHTIGREILYTQSGDRVRVVFQQAPGRADRIVLTFDNLEFALTSE